jgi:Holliday junction resolvase RusA-like endonuclease
MIEITLPWPPAKLSRNGSQGDYGGKARAARQYRSDSLICALRDARGFTVSHSGAIMLDIHFCAPDNRRRDLDNLLAMIKQGIDSIAEVLKVDDYRFEYTLRRGAMHNGGKIIVTI